MTSVEVVALLHARIKTVPDVDHLDRPPTDPVAMVRPYVVFYPSPGSPSDRRLDGQARTYYGVSRALCVNNSPGGALWLADAVMTVLDGWLTPTSVVECNASAPLSDPDMQAGFRWSCTVEITHESPR